VPSLAPKDPSLALLFRHFSRMIGRRASAEILSLL
jgi:hypothetical protein